MCIYKLTVEVDSGFRSLAAIHTVSQPSHTTNVQQLHERFTNWRSHVGAHVRGTLGLDYALRDAERLSTTVRDLLNDLIADISECTLDAATFSHPYSEAESTTSFNFTTTHTSQADVSTAKSPIIEERFNATSEQGSGSGLDVWDGIKESIDLLERLSPTLLQHEPQNHVEREFIAKVEQFETQDTWLVWQKYPSASAYVLQRLGKAVAKRRAILFSRIRSRCKEFDQDSAEKFVEEELRKIRELLELQSERMLLDEDLNSEGSSAYSYADDDLKEDQLFGPPAQHWSSEAQAKNRSSSHDTECPLCDAVLASDDPLRVRKHLCRDLEAYVCLVQDCPSPERLYRSRNAWTEHMKFVHGKIWRCFFGCTNPLGTRETFDEHLLECHRGSFTKAELPSLAEICEKHVLLDDDARCPLCKDVAVTGHRRQRHIGEHMEELALCALQPSYMRQTDSDHDYGYPLSQEADAAEETLERLSGTVSKFEQSQGTRSVGNISTAPTSVVGDAEVTTSASLRGRKDVQIHQSGNQADDGGSDNDHEDHERSGPRTSTSGSGRYVKDRVPQALLGSVDGHIAKLSDEGFLSRTVSDALHDTPLTWFPKPKGMTGSATGIFGSTYADVMHVEPSCAICGASAEPECPHEGQRLEIALNQAMERWSGLNIIRDWVVGQARNSILTTFAELKASRQDAHMAYLRTLPLFTLYQRYHGNPPVHAEQLRILQGQIQQARTVYKAGIDDDWRRSCLRYPEVLDYFFGLVEVGLPNDSNPGLLHPKIGAPKETGHLRKQKGGSKAKVNIPKVL